MLTPSGFICLRDFQVLALDKELQQFWYILLLRYLLRLNSVPESSVLLGIPLLADHAETIFIADCPRFQEQDGSLWIHN